MQDITINKNFRFVCRAGNYDMAKHMIETNSTLDISGSLCSACEGGNMCIIEMIFEKARTLKTSTNTNCGLRIACENGRVDIAKFMIEHGANDLRRGLVGAIENSHMNIVNFFMSQGYIYVKAL